jgi:hypothetical protein
VARREEYRGRLLETGYVQRPFHTDLVGRIIIASEVAGQPARIRVDLSPEEFRQACTALPDQKHVIVTGVIRHEVKAREYELHEVSNFRVAE